MIETLLGVTAKVITVSKGVEIDQKARELADHFDRQVSCQIACGKYSPEPGNIIPRIDVEQHQDVKVDKKPPLKGPAN